MKTKEESIKQVEENNKSFYNEALVFARNWIKGVDTFTSEDMIPNFGSKAREPRVWGAVLANLSKGGLISHHNWETYKGVQGHGKPVRVWKVMK